MRRLPINLQGHSGGEYNFLAIGPCDGQGVVGHTTSPTKTNPTDLLGRDNLKNHIESFLCSLGQSNAECDTSVICVSDVATALGIAVAVSVLGVLARSYKNAS